MNDLRDVAIALLLGILSNLLTFFITRFLVARSEESRFNVRTKENREKVADSAIGHLRSTYFALKHLLLDVLQLQRDLNDKQFQTILWGIRQALEQMRLSLQGHLNTWKGELGSSSTVYKDVQRIMDEDIIVSQNPPPIKAKLSELSPETLKDLDSEAVSTTKSLRDVTSSPHERILKAIAAGDIRTLQDEARILAERKTGGSVKTLLVIARALVSAGDEQIGGILVDILRNRHQDMSIVELKSAVGSLASYYINTDQERNGARVIEEIGSSLMQKNQLDDGTRAFVSNQVGKVLSGAGEHAKAVKYEEKAMALDAENAAYVHNAALSYQSLEEYNKAEQYFEKALQMSGHSDTVHLRSAIMFYSKRGNEERVEKLKQVLREKNPEEAQLIEFITASD